MDKNTTNKSKIQPMAHFFSGFRCLQPSFRGFYLRLGLNSSDSGLGAGSKEIANTPYSSHLSSNKCRSAVPKEHDHLWQCFSPGPNQDIAGM